MDWWGVMLPLYFYKWDDTIGGEMVKRGVDNPLVAAYMFEHVIPHYDVRAGLPSVTVPTLVCSGRHDWVTPVERMRGDRRAHSERGAGDVRSKRSYAVHRGAGEVRRRRARLSRADELNYGCIRRDFDSSRTAVRRNSQQIDVPYRKEPDRMSIRLLLRFRLLREN